MDATEAKRIAQKTLFAAWVERSAYEAILPPPWLQIDPTDVITVTFPGASFRMRLTAIDAGATSTSAPRVSPTASPLTLPVCLPMVAKASRRSDRHLSGNSLATYFILLDVPLLRDDDTGGAGSRVYFAGVGYGEAGWRGAVVYRSADGNSWTSIGALPGETSYGITLNALGAPRSPWPTNEDNVLMVAMTTGGDQLASVTQEVMLNGANAALLIKASGEPEIIQFRDVSYDAAANTYTLSGLLRGRRGTAVFTAGHTAGEIFLLLECGDDPNGGAGAG